MDICQTMKMYAMAAVVGITACACAPVVLSPKTNTVSGYDISQVNPELRRGISVIQPGAYNNSYAAPFMLSGTPDNVTIEDITAFNNALSVADRVNTNHIIEKNEMDDLLEAYNHFVSKNE